LETFITPKALVNNPHYQAQRQRTLAGLSDDMIDAPIVNLVNEFNALPYCFTLQCCYGHFLYDGQTDPHNLAPLPVTDAIDKVDYRIAYICLCVESGAWGKKLLEALDEITTLDPDNIQFCCAEWFWKRQANSYAVQVEPDRFKDQDRAILDYGEAVNLEKTRNAFFVRLEECVREQQARFVASRD
jgi:hypothetical protein